MTIMEFKCRYMLDLFPMPTHCFIIFWPSGEIKSSHNRFLWNQLNLQMATLTLLQTFGILGHEKNQRHLANLASSSMWVVDCSPQQISIISPIQQLLYLKVISRARKQLGSLLGAFILGNDSTHCVDDYTRVFQTTASKCITPRYTQLSANILLTGINCGFNMDTIYKMHSHILYCYSPSVVHVSL